MTRCYVGEREADLAVHFIGTATGAIGAGILPDKTARCRTGTLWFEQSGTRRNARAKSSTGYDDHRIAARGIEDL